MKELKDSKRRNAMFTIKTFCIFFYNEGFECFDCLSNQIESKHLSE